MGEELESMDSRKMSSDPYIYMRGSNNMYVYVYDCIILSKIEEEVDSNFK